MIIPTMINVAMRAIWRNSPTTKPWSRPILPDWDVRSLEEAAGGRMSS